MPNWACNLKTYLIMKNYLLLFFISLLASCNTISKQSLLEECDVVAENVVTDKGDTLLVCDYDAVSHYVSIPLSLLVDDYQLIKLDNLTKDMMLSNTINFFPSENYIVAWGNRNRELHIFNKNGEYIRKIGQPGNGPGDIVSKLGAIQIDELDDIIYYTDFDRTRMGMYQLSTGEYIGKLPLVYGAPLISILVNPKDKTIIGAINPVINDNVRIWKQDFDGNLIHNITSPTNDFIIWRQPYLWKTGKNITYYDYKLPQENDTLFNYNEIDNSLHPCFTVKYNGNTPDNWLFETKDYYILTINVKSDRNVTKFDNAPGKRILVDKKTLKGAYVDIVLDNHGNIPITKCRFYMWGEYLTLALSPEWVAEQCENVLRNSESLSSEEIVRLRDICDNITGEDNIFVLYGKIK